MTQFQNAKELTLLEVRRNVGEATTSLVFEAWIETLDRIGARVGSGALTRTERKLSLAAIAVIEEELDRAWRQMTASSEPGGDDHRSYDADGAREQILDGLVKLRVALTANLNQAAGPDE